MNGSDYNLLIEKYLSGTVTLEEEAMLEKYLEENPVHSPELLPYEKAEIGNRIRKRLFANTIRKPLRPMYFQMLAAAAFVIISGLVLYFVRDKNSSMTAVTTALNDRKEAFEVRNTSRKPQRVTLEDGSEIILQPNSKLSYPEHFGDRKRIVYLKGEAFFKVKRNPAKPFVVSTDNLATQVLGTSFNVKSHARSVEVQVATGKVSVYEVGESHAASKNGVILTPNQKIIFDKASRKMELGIVKNPLMLKTAADTPAFNFTEVPVAAIMETLESTYGINIVVEGDMLKNCLFTGDLNDLPMFQQLQLICKSVNVEYEQRGTSVFVFGEGCL
ncbi:FecR family protein [Dyadobacter sediminis]|uniref:DUF4974 domain-containing protein n=1 Tax=Dyadobacter sediminis TaxID=1493691 RepID=A0A5R9KBX3_9BACT|nr:FecR family protein [Dyadobacter sediminis]TLU92330.1 DUF4974 domain-containing protein [Dyadobacter sediminis]GGB95355.1 anti-sigma factor [Dyadobacter sediminis]